MKEETRLGHRFGRPLFGNPAVPAVIPNLCLSVFVVCLRYCHAVLMQIYADVIHIPPPVRRRFTRRRPFSLVPGFFWRKTQPTPRLRRARRLLSFSALFSALAQIDWQDRRPACQNVGAPFTAPAGPV